MGQVSDDRYKFKTRRHTVQIFILALFSGGFALAQTTEQSGFHVVMGRVSAVSSDSIEVQDSRDTQLFFSTAASTVWRGQERHDFSALQTNDEVLVRYRLDTSSRAVVIGLWANIDKVEGRITSVGRNGFQVDPNYRADPASAYRRGSREIAYDSGTIWEGSVATDLKAGRDVFVIGLKLPSGVLEATRVIVYEGGKPVRMKPSRIISPNGVVH
jgi:hypothetical protein